MVGQKARNIWDKIFIASILFLPITSFLVFWGFVNIQSIFMAFQTVDGAWSMETMKLVLEDLRNSNVNQSDLVVALKNTGIWLIRDTLMIAFEVFIGYFLYKKIKGAQAFRIIFYLPIIVSGVAISTVFKEFIAPDGPLNILYNKIGLADLAKYPNLLTERETALPTILFYSIWLGWAANMLLLSGTYARVPLEILESARLDGASWLRELGQIILPLISSTITTLFILSLTSVFATTGPIMLFDEWSTYGTQTVGYWIYSRVRLGSAYLNQVAATGLLCTAVGAPCILIIRWLLEKIPTVDY